MVSLKEIRVGNWLLVVFAPENHSGPVINYQPKAVEESDLVALNTFLPMPLTIDLLRKCGFIEEGGVWCKYQQVGEGRALVLKRKQKEEWYVADIKIKAPPLYMHQLQNLFYALTGKELKVALDTYRIFDPSMMVL
jgi:hypothetical protein